MGMKKLIRLMIIVCLMRIRKYLIFDQLNPTYAYFYKKKELRKLLNKANFKNLKFFHKDKYSWTVVCKKS